MSRKNGASTKRIGDIEGCFLPFWVYHASTLGAKAEWRQSKGRVEASCAPTVNYIIPEKSKIRVPLLRKKVTPDDNNNNKRCEATIPTHFTDSKVNAMTDSYIRSTVHTFCMTP